MKKKRPAPTEGYVTRALVAEDPVIPRKRKRVYRRRDMRAKS